ncbi:DUF4112 domain-containing protein [Oscillatoria sp. FACHB-1406]|uniref:DUF4112 domain-containing protein n=1 Tax=Oscillatoria sp. FACHB-1406 TaxID=2692846 RepID=UPI001686A7D9|nr:DUF4112 domain-containing protein [Oscillatoria sp. FACHB-1406]MBD2579680.1 DUF4112 domain-containing protein [Oscillatoria sp. FACHB-1406]
MIQPAKSTHIRTLEQLRSLTNLLDNAVGIPGTRYRVGLDPVLGLLPGVGDYAGAMMSSYIVIQAARMGASRATLGRMVSNIILDSFVGMVPLFGDLFDAGWKANTKNIALLEQHLELPQSRQKADWLFLGLLLGGLLLVLLLVTAISVTLFQGVFRFLQFLFAR